MKTPPAVFSSHPWCVHDGYMTQGTENRFIACDSISLVTPHTCMLVLFPASADCTYYPHPALIHIICWATPLAEAHASHSHLPHAGGGRAQEVGDRLRQLMALDANLRATLAEKARPKGAPKPSVNAAALVRGLRRRSWTGPAWLGSITENGQVWQSCAHMFSIISQVVAAHSLVHNSGDKCWEGQLCGGMRA